MIYAQQQRMHLENMCIPLEYTIHLLCVTVQYVYHTLIVLVAVHQDSYNPLGDQGLHGHSSEICYMKHSGTKCLGAQIF